ncbi:uncharacterized protein IL334_003926 [Kwoniella shivajii]|uniref:Uncharacterized protein n=1 Tax=Kwoniella shivajii TaxID=564305 RepID=A0ABZ1CZB5_9TREE|nr:hypothetical protein IL334_003926 [Kwoniella shivajii]
MGVTLSKSNKLSVADIPSDLISSSEHSLFVIMIYPDGIEHGPDPVWQGSIEPTIHQELPPNTTLYGWVSPKAFDQNKVERFICSVRSKEMEAKVRYRLMGPKHLTQDHIHDDNDKTDDES